MNKFFSYKLNEYETVRPVNIIRVIQFILCGTCLGIAIYFILSYARMHLVILTIITITGGAFFFITLIDIISQSYLLPITWNSWVPISLSASLFYFLCAGFMFFQTQSASLFIYILGGVVSVLAGIAFLIDLLVLFSRIANGTTLKMKRSTIETVPIRAQDIVLVQSAPQRYRSSDTQTPRKSRGKCECKSAKQPPHSYGGTFPVSKDTPPLPGPYDEPMKGIQVKITPVNKTMLGPITSSPRKSEEERKNRKVNAEKCMCGMKLSGGGIRTCCNINCSADVKETIKRVKSEKFCTNPKCKCSHKDSSKRNGLDLEEEERKLSTIMEQLDSTTDSSDYTSYRRGDVDSSDSRITCSKYIECDLPGSADRSPYSYRKKDKEDNLNVV